MNRRKGFLLLEFVVALGLFVLFVSILTRLHTNVNATQHNAQDRMMALDLALNTLADSSTSSADKRFSIASTLVKPEPGSSDAMLKQVTVKWQTSTDVSQALRMVGVE